MLNFFKQLGKNITEEEIYVLKQSYNQAQKNNEALTIQQLDDVAGGVVKGLVHIDTKGTRSEYADLNICKVNISFNPQGKFDCYTLHDGCGKAFVARNLCRLKYEPENAGETTPLNEQEILESVLVGTRNGTFVRKELIGAKEQYSAILVGENMYFYGTEAFHSIDKNRLEGILGHVTPRRLEELERND